MGPEGSVGNGCKQSEILSVSSVSNHKLFANTKIVSEYNVEIFTYG